MTVARLVRGEFLAIRVRDFIDAARAFLAAPSLARFTRPSSLMSRDSVACVTSKPRDRSRRRSPS